MATVVLAALGLSCTRDSSILAPSSPAVHAIGPWHEGVDDYVWSVKMECFCPPTAYTVTVANGVPTDLKVNGESGGLHGPYAKHLPLTVPDFLEMIQRARTDARGLRVNPSPGSDLPLSVWINWSFVSDDEIKFTVTSFQPS